MGPLNKVEIGRVLQTADGGEIQELVDEKYLKMAEHVFERYEMRPKVRPAGESVQKAVERGIGGRGWGESNT